MVLVGHGDARRNFLLAYVIFSANRNYYVMFSANRRRELLFSLLAGVSLVRKDSTCRGESRERAYGTTDSGPECGRLMWIATPNVRRA